MSGSLHTMDGEDGHHSGGHRTLGNGHNQESALQLFVNAKKKINDIFRNIGQYVLEADEFVTGVSSSVDCSEIVTEENAKVVQGFKEKIIGITEVLARDHMKVVFFGRTSNGKSTVINAMLRDKILPSGIGHTTNCFIQVEGSDSSEGFLLTEDTDKPKSITDIKQLASALSSVKLQENSLIRIIWPKAKCRLLREDVVLVDSPGIDVTPDLDLWIDKFCLDADVFVLVSNAESTLMQTEKNFFHKVSAKLSKPNIFILQNRWDVSEMEEEIDQVRQQHLDRNTHFLADELNVVDKKAAKDRIYFVSAREALASRLNNDKGTPTPDRVLLPGFQSRLFEFANFEKEFETCISQSAVSTKFEQHTKRAHAINSELRSVMEETYRNSLSLQEEKLQIRKERLEKLSMLDKQLNSLNKDVKSKIELMVQDVEKKVSSALNDEIRRLSYLVEEYERPFHPDASLLNVYKKELHLFLEQRLCGNLTGRCSSPIIRNLDHMQFILAERLASILPEDDKQQVLNLMPKRDFEIAYRLDCRNLCAGFREDIQFRFSLSPTALLQRIMGSKSRLNLRLLGETNTGHRENSSTPQGDASSGIANLESDNEVLMTLLTTITSFTTKSSLGAVVMAGLVAKAAGWKVIIAVGTIYGGVYCYERLTWTTKAREKVFKQQYVDYASSKLKLIVDLTSSNCSHQVQQELTSTFARLCHQADVSKKQLEDEIKEVDKGLHSLRDITSRAKSLRNKADFFDSELREFVAKFLQNAGL